MFDGIGYYSVLSFKMIRALLVKAGGQATDSFSYTQMPYFTDVPVGSPFFNFVQKMRDLGITMGTSATTYSPDDPVTREEMAAFLSRAFLGLK